MAENDLGKIVNLIMQNPELIEQIKKLGEKGENTSESSTDATVVSDGAVTDTKEQIPASVSTDRTGERSRRRELLCALKPYVSEERGRAIDSMMSIADILDVMRAK